MAARFQSVAGFPLRGDAAYFSASLREVIARPEAECFVIDDGAQLLGFILVELSRSHLTPAPIANEVLLWIEPEHRGRWFRSLITRYEAWAKHNGAQAAYLSAQMDGRTSAVFERMGFDAVQTHHVKVF